ncbi:uncharacterized protein [Anabrus simplex]|uniref:uncharacterized protein n=1 Tax=Anabrus simplex TaxID=316456 RepID=UPI0035A3C325
MEIFILMYNLSPILRLAKKYKSLKLNEKVKVIEASDKEKLSVREIMSRFRCGKTQLGNTAFKESTGWLESFKTRHNIVWNEVCGKSKDVDGNVVAEWKSKLKI